MMGAGEEVLLKIEEATGIDGLMKIPTDQEDPVDIVTLASTIKDVDQMVISQAGKMDFHGVGAETMAMIGGVTMVEDTKVMARLCLV